MRKQSHGKAKELAPQLVCALAKVSLWTMSTSFIHVIACIKTSFLFKAEYSSVVCVDDVSFIHLSINVSLGCIYLLAIVNAAAVNMGVQISV